MAPWSEPHAWLRTVVGTAAAALLVTASLTVLSTAAPGAPARPHGCTITGTPGADVLAGTKHDDVICGRGGADVLRGRGGDDVLRGGPGADTLTGGRGDDQISGGPGNDKLRAHDLNTFQDVLTCGSGSADTAEIDPNDIVSPSCELVTENNAATAVTLTPSEVAENQPVGTVVGQLAAVPSTPGNDNEFELVAGIGSDDNASFTIDGDELLTEASFDFEADPQLAVRIRATDEHGISTESTLIVLVTDVFENVAPVAVDDVVSTSEDTPLVLTATGAGGPAANDTDADGDPTTVIAVSGATGGSVVLDVPGNKLTFTPNADVCGSAAGGFDYTVSDGRGGSDTGHVAVDISCTADPTIARDDSATIAEDAPATAVPVLANDTDADGDAFSITAKTNGAHGAVVITGGGTGLTYAPAANYCGSDTFTYTLSTGPTATVTMTVTCVDDAPVAVDDSKTITEDDAATAVTVLANDTDVDAGPKSVQSKTNGAHGTVVITGGGTGLTYAPAANYCGGDTFTYTLNGGSSATVTMTITCVDDDPVAVDDSKTITEDDAATAVDVLANDTDVDAGTKSVQSKTNGAHGTVVITGGGTGLTYAPAANYCGSDTFTYTLNGGSSATVTMTITCVDDDPVAVDDGIGINEDTGATALPVLGNDTDVDGGTKSIQSKTNGAHGLVAITGGGTGLTYAPAANYCGSDSFTYTLNGGSTATVSMVVSCVDDPPVAVDDSFTIALDATTTLDVRANDTDIDAGTKSVVSTTDGAHGTVAITGGGTGVSYDPDPGYCNDTTPDTFTYTLNGGSSATVSVTVSCNNAPTAVDDNATRVEDSGANAINVLANDSDPDGDTLSVVLKTNGADGTVVIVGGGSGLTYEPDPDFCGSDDFTYTVGDGHGGTDTADVHMTITCTDDDPVAVDDSATKAEDSGATAVDVLTNDTDVDGGTMSIQSKTNGSHGAVAITGGGTGLTYQPDADYCGSDSFTYSLNGGSTATVSVTVTCVNDPPVAADFSFTGDKAAIGNTALIVDDPTDGAPTLAQPKSVVTGDLLGGATDPDGGPLDIVAGTFASGDGGSVTIQSDGDFTFHPKASANCADTSDTFDYTVEDSDSATDTGTVTVGIVGCVWYVDNTAAAGGTGTSNDPFDTLVEAETASGADDTVFVYRGDGTSTGYDTGYQMDPQGRLIGEIAGLTVDPDGSGGALVARALYPATANARPALTATNEDVVALDDANEVRGFLLDPSGTGRGIGGSAGDTGGGTIADVRIIDTGTAGSQPGLELVSTTGTFQVSDLEVDNTGATAPPSSAIGVRLVSAGTVDFAASGTVSVATKGAQGLAIANTAMGTSVFDDVTVTSASGGLFMDNDTGSTTFTNLSLTTTGAFQALHLGNAGTVTVPGAGTANINATGGTAVDVNNTTAALALDQVQATNATIGVNLINFGTSTFSADATSEISGAAGTSFVLTGGSGTVTYAGDLSNGAGATAAISGRTGGVVTFSGAIADSADAGGGIAVSNNTGGSTVFSGTKVLDTGAVGAVAMTNSDGHTLSFTGGGLDLTSTTGRGLQADTSGTITVTGTGNKIVTTTGIALDVSNTDIGASGLTFQSITANGATNGIRLNHTGSAAGLTVTGNGGTCTNANTAGCSGGQITGAAVAANDATTAPIGTGIVLNDTDDPSLTRMWVHGNDNYAIRGASVDGLTLANSVVNGNNGDDAAAEEAAVWFTDLTGSASVSNTWVSGGIEDNFRVENGSGSLDRITFTGVTFGASGTRPQSDALSLTSTGSATFKATITGSTFSSAAGDLLQFDHGGSGLGDLVVDTNQFVNVHPAIAAGGGGVTLSNDGTSGDTTMDINANVFKGAVGHAVTIVKTAGTSIQAGTFTGNTIGTAGVQNSGSSEGSGLKIQLVNQGTSTWTVDNNTIRGYNNFGVEVVAGGGAVAASGNLNTTITDNNIAEPGDLAGFTKYGVMLNIGTVPTDSFAACADIDGNTMSSSGSTAIDARLRQRQATTVRLPGYAGASSNTAAVQTFVSGKNGGADISAAVSGSGGGFIGTGTDCF